MPNLCLPDTARGRALATTLLTLALLAGGGMARAQTAESLPQTVLSIGPLAQTGGPAASSPSSSSTTTATGSASGDRDRWYLQTSLYTRHFHADPRHQNHNRLLNLEYQRADNWLAGGAIFRNSFDQPSQYLYIGKLWRPFDEHQSVHVKLTGGLLHGYKGEFRDKIPFNHAGVAPAILPAIGWSTKRFATELILFGTNGAMVTVGVYLN